MKTILVFLIAVSLMTSMNNCNTNSKPFIKKIEKAIIDSSVVYRFDTTQYRLHKSGFYVSKTGEVYQANHVADIGPNGNIVDEDWLDNEMFYGEYPNRKALKDIVDLDTYVADSLSRFAKDKKRVYYAYGTSDGVRRFVVEKADPKTFKALNQEYGKDKANIYHRSEIVKGADWKTFKVSPNNRDSASDKNYRYHYGQREE